MAVQPGNTFLDTSDNPHLWIVVAGPDANNSVILVNLTSLKGRDDRTTLCGTGDHPFITRPSAVAYKYADHVQVKNIEEALVNGKFIRREDCSAEFLRRIVDGLLRSNSTPLRIANAYVDVLRNPPGAS